MEEVSIEKNFVAKDIFGNVFEPGDLFLYCPGSKRNASLKVGIFIEVKELIPLKKQKSEVKMSVTQQILQRMDQAKPHRPDVRVKLMNDYGFGEVFSDIHLDTFGQRSSLLSHPEFVLDSKIIQRAIQVRDDLIDAGLIRRDYERISNHFQGT